MFLIQLDRISIIFRHEWKGKKALTPDSLVITKGDLVMSLDGFKKYYPDETPTPYNADGWDKSDETIYTDNDPDVRRDIDCPLTPGPHEASVYVYRDRFLLFQFASFKHNVEGGK